MSLEFMSLINFLFCPSSPKRHALIKLECLGYGGLIPSGCYHPLLAPAAPFSGKQLPEHLPSPPSPAPPHSSPPRLGQPLLKGLPGSPSPCHYDANRVVNFSEMQKESPNLF